jgi:hypothetical protein
MPSVSPFVLSLIKGLSGFRGIFYVPSGIASMGLPLRRSEGTPSGTLVLPVLYSTIKKFSLLLDISKTPLFPKGCLWQGDGGIL